MSQFDVHRTRGEAAALAPYLVILQTDFAADLDTVVVAPLRPAAAIQPKLKRLHVAVDFQDGAYVVAPHEMASLPRTVLGAHAGSLARARQDLMAAIDFLFLGF